MTRKEKKLISLLREFKEFESTKDKDLVKSIYTTSPNFDNLSPFSWQEHHGEKKMKQKLLKTFTKK